MPKGIRSEAAEAEYRSADRSRKKFRLPEHADKTILASAIGLLESTVQEDSSWYDRAECKGAPPIFFDSSETSDATELALRYCERCPVLTNCLAFSLTNGEMEGIWGGIFMTPRRFYSIRRTLRRYVQRRK